jgi:trehalose synthase-fused probable maltokinase
MAAPGFGKDMFSNLKTELPAQLPAYLKGQRWFGAKAREVRATEVVDFVTLERDELHALVVVVKVEYEGGGADLYSLPLVVTKHADPKKDPGSNLKGEPGAPGAVLTVSGRGGGEAITLTDALKNETFLSFLLDAIERGLVFTGEVGELVTSRTHGLSMQETGAAGSLRPRAITAEQSNSSVAYGDRLILKFFRRLEEGVNPDLEVGGFLTEKAHYQHTPQLLGALEYREAHGLGMTQGILQGFVPNQGDAWQYTMKSISAFYNEVGKNSAEGAVADSRNVTARALIAPFLESVGLLARRTAELHLALASPAAAAEPDFAPEPFDDTFQRGFEDALLELTNRIFRQLRHAHDRLPENAKPKVEKVLSSEPQIIERFHAALSVPIRAVRTRIHGDYHLGQVLYTGADFVIIDFEGEPARPLSQRRLKRSPLQDVAGMLRSFHYAAHAPLLAATGSVNVNGNREKLNGWAEVWVKWVSERFLEEYMKTARGAEFLPPSREGIDSLLQLHVLEKAVYELGYELNNRPDWVAIPLEGISKSLESSNL